ncbi:MAG: bifunctional prephenate dehydrogenase/3-phosphoshikimate 1-carboxyvinyltransferase [Pseudomonadota bacterium]|nr:bifunctional prephenate dehydrogenase/3-phosphoshikimate 1-carboxyvinyltransferase [Pseudomonadota bacterium]
MLNKLVIIGLGLIGGSIAKAAKAPTSESASSQPLAKTIVGVSRRVQPLKWAKEQGIIDHYETDIALTCQDADMIVLCCPVGVMQSAMEAIKPVLAKDCILTDAGSTKGSVVEAAKAVWPTLPEGFVPGHPIAGSEQSGVAAAKADLYVGHKVIITPLPSSAAWAQERLRAFWQNIGADVLEMPVEQHDDVLAATSHLPHLLAYTLVDCLAQEDENREIFRYAAGGFRDFTRIASSDPVMWRDIFQHNQAAALKMIDDFSAHLLQMRAAIDKGDGETLLATFTRAKAARDHFMAMNAKTSYTKAKQLNERGQAPLNQGKPMSTNSSAQAEHKLTYTVSPASDLHGVARVPGDKSISHRSIMFGSIAKGVTEISGFLEGEDALATLQAFRDMGVMIEGPDEGFVRVHGVGMHGLKAPKDELYMGNSGTSMRLLSGLLAGQQFDVTLTGDASLSKRPMERVAKPLREMGARVETAENGRPPMKIFGNSVLNGIDYVLPMASAQVKSCVLLAGLYAKGDTSVTEPAVTRDHTERMLRAFGVDIRTSGEQGEHILLKADQQLRATQIDVPADISSAAFFMVAASIAQSADITLEHVGLNPTRVGILNILKAMGADFELLNEQEVGGEPVADIRVRSGQLKGIHIPEDQVPLAIDEMPILFIAAACADGETLLTGAEELRVKESDRIQVMADGLATLGVKHETLPDGIRIQGNTERHVFGGGEIFSHGDHRIAMSFSVASLRAAEPIIIHGAEHVATSFPSFVDLANKLGLSIRV